MSKKITSGRHLAMVRKWLEINSKDFSYGDQKKKVEFNHEVTVHDFELLAQFIRDSTLQEVRLTTPDLCKSFEPSCGALDPRYLCEKCGHTLGLHVILEGTDILSLYAHKEKKEKDK